MQDTKISDRREFDLDDGSEEVTVRLHERDRLRIVTASGAEFSIQDDMDGRPEIVILDGSPCIWT